MRVFVVIGLLASAQFAQRAPLSVAETLLDPVVLRALDNVAPAPAGRIDAIAGADPAAGDIVISCYSGAGAAGGCAAASQLAQKFKTLIELHQLPQPARSVRFISVADAAAAAVLAQTTTGFGGRVKAAIHLDMALAGRTLQLVRSPWSASSITDEVAELFARHAPYGSTPGAVDVAPFRGIGQPAWDAHGIPTITLVGGGADAAGLKHLVFVSAATAYFLATLPNDGAEALLSHLMVGAHSRLAEDGRKAVAQMGSQQRASADVLIMFGQAIEREQRRIRSFANYMPVPVDAMLTSRLGDMQKSITSVWTSMAITSSPFVPAAERIRGRGGEDRRVPARTGKGPLLAVNPPAAFLKLTNSGDVMYEIGNFIDGKRSISDIRDAVSGEFGPLPLPPVVEYFEMLAKTGSVTLR